MAEEAVNRTAVRRLPRDQRVAAILQNARIVLRERGYENFLTSEVAELCGVSEATVYKYFSTKRDLLIQVAESWFEEFLGESLPPIRQNTFRDRLLHVIWHSLSLIRREPALTRFVLMELRADANYRQMRIYDLNRQISARVMDVVAEGARQGAVRPEIPMKLIRDMIFGAIEHQTWAYLRGEGDFSVEDSAAGIADVIYAGISAHQTGETDLDRVVGRLEKVAAALETVPAQGASSAKP